MSSKRKLKRNANIVNSVVNIHEKSKLCAIKDIDYKFDKEVERVNLNGICQKNCSLCCHDFFFISFNDFLYIVHELETRGKSLKPYIKKANEVRNFYMLNYPEKYDILVTKMPDGQYASTDTRYIYEYFENEKNRYKLPACIFLNNGKCDIYNFRPSICRMYGTSNKCSLMQDINEVISDDVLYEFTKVHDFIETTTYGHIQDRPYPLFYLFSEYLGTKKEIVVKNRLKLIRENTKDIANFEK
ncbi:MAG: YkgJ family cysteine cluster protein [Bacilli bacterium]